MEKGYLDVVLNKEKLSAGEDIFVANCVSLGIASQGKTMDEAMANIKEAIALYLEEQPELYEELSTTIPSFSVIELDKHAKTSSIIR
jgi:predicted RNase H-like HicB family nuclease